jgi:hypothetical protein
MMSVASTAAMKEVIEYRLTHSIPWFQTVMGAVQDAQTQGAVVSYNYWEYETRKGRKVKDKPCVQLRPIENIRLDGGADWTDPVGTSPYFCDIIPMYVYQVRHMMSAKDEKTGAPKWKKYKDEIICKAKPEVIDTLRQARLGQKQDPELDRAQIKDFDVVWVMRWFMKDPIGDDYAFYTLSTEQLLTDPVPIEETYFHGVRPYVMGYAVLETHKAIKTSMPMLIKPLQQELADIRNQRLDNVKFVLNKRWLVARGRQVDVNSLVRNVPGGVTLTTDPKNDIVESNWPDVTSSSYVEQDRLKSDLDELAGNFSPSTKVANNAVNDTLGGSRMASQGAGLMTDYLLRTIIETWMEPTLRHIVKLEAKYETDDIVLSVAAKKARLFPRFGLSQITDQMLESETHVTVNVGMGSSDPAQRMQKFLMATQAALGIVSNAPPGFNVMEAIKEIYSNAGYRDGARFFSEQGDPRLGKAMQMIQQLQGMLKGKEMEMRFQAQLEAAKIQSNERIKVAQLQVDSGRIQGDLQIRQSEISVQEAELQVKRAEVLIDEQRLELEKVKVQLEAQQHVDEMENNNVKDRLKVDEAALKLEGERQKIAGQAMKIDADIEKAKFDLEKSKSERDNEQALKVAEGVTKAMADVAKDIAKVKATLSEVQGNAQTIGQGLSAVLGVVGQPKRKPKGLKLQKDENSKTKGVAVDYDDGSVEVIPVG